ncbi:bifunctional folylpolyglutamate synthase/dihydrofolate synthase [Chloroflexota bacterium]
MLSHNIDNIGMDYQAALDYILGFADYERASRSAVVFDLRRMERLLARLGNPQAPGRTVHVAGTKGKGSTCAMLSSIIGSAGYRVGLYTSPHLLSFTERVQVDDSPISLEDFARLVAAMKPDVEAVNRYGAFGELTTFELLTALAFAYFRERAVDFKVLETGMGGRLDATNIVGPPDVCVITSISLDHTEVLGDTLARIAEEKAGIIKAGSTVVCAPQPPEAMAVIERVCLERGVGLVRVGGEVTWECQGVGTEGQRFRVRGTAGEYELSLPLLGEHQLENAATAVAAAEVLVGHGAAIPAGRIAAGLKQVRWPGRLQVLRRRPWLVVDGAHNADSARRLTESLERYFDFYRLVLIVGTSVDKDITGMIKELASPPGMVIATRSRHPRAVPPDRLVVEFSKWGITPLVTEDIAAAMELALALATEADLICATGSLFVVAEVMEHWVSIYRSGSRAPAAYRRPRTTSA